MTRPNRSYMPLLGASLLLSFAPGCKSGDAPATVSTNAAADVQELTVGALQDDFGLQLNRPRLGIYPLNTGICEPLMKLTNELQEMHWLATRSEYRGDNTYRFTLRNDVIFHDGSRFDANAVKYTLDHAIRVKTQYSFLSDNSRGQQLPARGSCPPARDSTRSLPLHLPANPGMAIGLVVIGFNLLGDGLRDMLDPRVPGRQRRTPPSAVASPYG